MPVSGKPRPSGARPSLSLPPDVRLRLSVLKECFSLHTAATTYTELPRLHKVTLQGNQREPSISLDMCVFS